MMVVSEMFLMGIALFVVFETFGFILYYINLRRNAPEAFIFAKARKKKMPVCLVHYPENIVRPFIPKIEKHSPEASTPYFIVGEVGIKFRNPDGRKVERWNGDVPLFNYFVNMPESVAITEAVAYSQLKDHLKKEDVDIDTIEDVAFYVLSEFERTGDINVALTNAKIENDETIKHLLTFINHMNAHKKDIENLKLQSGIFTFQTAIRALDATIAYTSSNVAHMKSVIEASIRRQLASSNADIMRYGMFVFLCMMGIGALYVLTRT